MESFFDMIMIPSQIEDHLKYKMHQNVFKISIRSSYKENAVILGGLNLLLLTGRDHNASWIKNTLKLDFSQNFLAFSTELN